MTRDNHNTILKFFSLSEANVAYALQDGVHKALHNINLTIKPGTWLAIVGVNGSGKSTLAQVAAGLIPLSSGSLCVSSYCRRAIVMQQPGLQLIGATLIEDLQFGMQNVGIPFGEWDERIAEALHRVGLRLPLDQPLAFLSGGQKQRVAIAGALSVGATLLILDEPTSMLDAQDRAALLDTVSALHQAGTSVLWITHRLDELAFADSVAVLQSGELVYAGTPRDFFYGTGKKDDAPPPCTAFGFTVPYVPSVAIELKEKGLTLSSQPLHVRELADAVAEVLL